MHIKTTMSINTTKKDILWLWWKMKKFIDEKSLKKTLAFHELSNTKNNGKIHHFPFLNQRRKQEHKKNKNKKNKLLFFLLFFFDFSALLLLTLGSFYSFFFSACFFLLLSFNCPKKPACFSSHLWHFIATSNVRN